MTVNDVKQAMPAVPEDLAEMTAKHPCYSFDAHHKFARMHLPVAPACNIACNYCSRKYDCVNESRPGVTSEVLTPERSLAKFIRVKAALPQLSVVGIAGPGDALANWESVKNSILLIKAESPETIFCLSTNGLMLPHYWREIIELGVKHVTVTVNCLEPAIGAKIYRYVHYQGKYYAGEAGAELLIRQQLAGIKLLAENGVLVKVNVVMVKGLNDGHIPLLVKKVKSLGALMSNIMPLIPAPGSVFQNFPQTSMKEIKAMRDLCQPELYQMRHCRQCRADAIGLLGEDLAYQFRDVRKEPVAGYSGWTGNCTIAVTSGPKKMVDLHYGEAEVFHIYETNGKIVRFIETRAVPGYCRGTSGCDNMEKIKAAPLEGLAGCDAVLTMRIGYEARKHLEEQGIFVAEACGALEENLLRVYGECCGNAEVRSAACRGGRTTA